MTRKAQSAPAVDFSEELGLSYPSLATLGGRVDSARESEDPVALAVASVELAADEKASGKTDDVKSTDLASEAIELAKERFHPAELKSVAAVLSGNSEAAKLTDVAGKAEQMEAAAKATKDSVASAMCPGIRGADAPAPTLSPKGGLRIDFPTDPSLPSDKFGVFIGIGRYSGLPAVNPLDGPARDVTALKDIFQTTFGFKRIAILTDEQATRQNIGQVPQALASLRSSIANSFGMAVISFSLSFTPSCASTTLFCVVNALTM
jgi:hypothetical protein